MSSHVTTAVILAAGLGTRLKHHTKAQPKGFLEVDGMSLIERSLSNLTLRHYGHHYRYGLPSQAF